MRLTLLSPSLNQNLFSADSEVSKLCDKCTEWKGMERKGMERKGRKGRGCRGKGKGRIERKDVEMTRNVTGWEKEGSLVNE